MGLLTPWAKVEIERPLAENTALKQRVDDLERQLRGMKLEWENVYDKLMKAVSRINARSRRENQEEPPPAELPEDEPPLHGFGSHAALRAARERKKRA